MWWKLLLGLGVGGGVGFLWSRMVGCRTGGCPITSRWPTATLFGAGLGLLLVLQIQPCGQGACPLASLFAPGRSSVTEAQGQGRKITEASAMAEQIKSDLDFDSKVLNAGKPVLVDFYADWCGPCKFLAPVIEEIAKDLAGKVDVYKINVDDVQSLAAKYGIQSIPTVMVFSGGEPVKQFVGVRGKEEYVSAIKSLGT
jgi:thioredoxin 1